MQQSLFVSSLVAVYIYTYVNQGKWEKGAIQKRWIERKKYCFPFGFFQP